MKILFFDIESSYCTARVWRTGKQYVSHDQIVKASDIICICWKWGGERKVHSLDWGIKKQDSSKMVETITEVVEQADLAIGHNEDNFDIKHINTQRLLKGQPPIAWPTTEDTLKQFRKHFYLPSCKLDYLAKLLTGSGKKTMVFQDWVDIVELKEAKALEKMVQYCKIDVKKLEEIYNLAKAHFKPKINAGLLADKGRYACPRCASKNVRGHGIRVTMARRYQRMLCSTCGTTFTGATI